jgi:argininosuccinate lyase
MDELNRFSPLISEDIFGYLTVDQMIQRRKSYGGASSETVQAAIRRAEEMLGSEVVR